MSTGSRPDSRASGPTIMSAGSRPGINSNASLPFRSALDVDIVFPKKDDSTHAARITSAPHGMCGRISHRYVFATLCSMGLAITYGLKVNFHVCIVTMINHTALAKTGEDEGHGGGGESNCVAKMANGSKAADTGAMDGPFTWNPIIQGVLLSAYFYGYLVTQLIGGRLSEVLSAKWTFGVATLLNIVFTLLTPTAAYTSWGALLVIRILEGMMGGVTLPATHVLLSKWSPKSEMSRLSSAVYAGLSLGTVLSVSSTGLIAGTLGWEVVFYIHGSLALIFIVLWSTLVYDSPAFHPWISSSEKNLIMDSTGHDHHHKDSPPVPWKAIWMSKPFWAILISHTGSNFGWYMLLTELPSYMSGILGFDIKSNALLSALPFLVMWVYSILFGNLMDHLGARGIMTRTQMTKLATGIAAFIPAICLVVVTFVGCDKALAVFLLTLCTGTFGSMYSGFLANHIQIAPIFAGTLMAITNTVATIPGMVVPSFVGAMIHEHNTIDKWRVIFCTTAGILTAQGIQYMFLASGEEEEWSSKAHNPDD
ncbi:putative inorganic phosphate cotransporter [Pollicipes pollicipes]|uniref:putative inorganic phosphate cotransporter n=1 Tax=Pollicipes pollicipes TaxID=41117 RepID=UPI001884B8FC|nr:putative inorganic phosphate cotransporter [Pollicipes pollicipes]